MSNACNRRNTHITIFRAIIAFVFSLSLQTFYFIPAISASSEAAAWTRVNIPTEGEAGGWVLADDSDVQHLTMSADGTFYAYGKGLTYTLLKSTDGGLRWTNIGKVNNVITGIAVSPYDTGSIYYTTSGAVFRSTDGGKSFILLPPIPGVGTGNVTITSIAAAWLNGNIIAVSTRDTDSSEYGGVYILDETAIIPEWIDSGIGNYDVYTVAFSPGYTSDRQIIAAATDETDTFIISKIGNADWSAFIGPARLNQDNSSSLTPVAIAESAVFAFPDNYTTEYDSAEGVFFVGINTGSGEGDVYKIICIEVPGNSMAIDLNAGGFYGVTNTDISGLTAFSDGGNITVLAGSADSTRIYASTDGGANWTRSYKSPTGDVDTSILLAPDFSETGVIFAATSGNNSALSVSRDAGVNWNQVSLIDTVISSIVDIAPSQNYEQDNTLFMTTLGGTPSSGGFWRTTDRGFTWERTLSGTHPNVDILNLIGIPPQYGSDCSTVFISGESSGNPAIWESDDGGQIFRCRVPRDPSSGTAFPIDAWTVADGNAIYIASYDGAQSVIYQTVNGGSSFSAGVPAGTHSTYSLALSPDFENDGIMLVGNNDGMVYISMDGGALFLPLPSDSVPALSGGVAVAFDPDFKTNRTVYAGNNAADAGFYRFTIGSSDNWESIDGTLLAGATINHLAVSGEGILYGVNSASNGGMERCLNPRFFSGPVFETVTRGLSDGAKLSGIRQAGNRIWSIDIHNCKLMTFLDTLASPVVQSSPENAVSGIGSIVDHTVRNVTIDWETIDGATGYEWQCTYDTSFSAIPSGLEGTASASSIRLPALEPATTYHWRVRASSPVLSPWSDKRSFITSMDSEVITLKPESPTAGASGISIRPVFQWTAVVGASAYELLVSADADFDDPVIIRINEYALPTNVWQCDVSLDYNTTYYWKVRATASGTHGTWSSTGVFTTKPTVDEEPSPEPTDFPPGDGQDSLLALSALKNAAPLATTPTPEQMGSPATSTPQPIVIQIPTSGLDVPPWIIYLIGGLLTIVILALSIVLMVVVKIKRF